MKAGVRGFSPGKNFKFKVAIPLNLILRVYLTAQRTVEDCSQLGWYLLPSWLWRWKTRLGFQISRFTCTLRLTSLLNLCLSILQAPAQRKVANSSWMLKTVQSLAYIRSGRVSFYFLCFCTCSLLSPALHLLSARVSYVGDCLIALANISAVRCSTFACAWQVGALRSVSRKGSKPKRKEAHAVDPPAFFCERFVPLLCLLVLSTTRVEREVPENTAL